MTCNQRGPHEPGESGRPYAYNLEEQVIMYAGPIEGCATKA